MFSNTLKKALVVASVTLTLPVLGATAAYADGSDNGHGRGSSAAHASTAAPSEHGSSKGTETDPSGSSTNPDGTFQGASTSTPDQDGKGADHGDANNDKTGPGTDGNNGCGNEPRLAAPRDGGRPTDDDNNGWCGSKPKPVHATRVQATAVRIDSPKGTEVTKVAAAPAQPAPVTTHLTAPAPAAAPAAVLAAPVTGELSAEAVAPAVVVEGPVQGPVARTTGAAASAAAGATALPFTGAPVGLLLVVAGLCLGLGSALSLAGTRRTA